MRPPLWQPAQALTAVEAQILRRIQRAKLFVFLRTWRHELFGAAFQAELGGTYVESPFGQPPAPPARLALATILQAYMGISDDEVIECTLMDRRWQLVLDCLDCAYPPFSKGTLVAFRQRLIAHDLDRRLIEQTVLVAERRRAFGSRALRAALDSSPLWGAGRVEDTYNLLGHALRLALGVLARQQGRELTAVAAQAQVPLLGGSSLKAALDCDWSDPLARDGALAQVVQTLEQVTDWLEAQPVSPAQARAQGWVDVAQGGADQDVVVGADGCPTLRQGVAPERRISVQDPAMRHGRKSRSQRIDGYKRHVVRDLDHQLVRAVGLTAANAPEASVAAAVLADLAHQEVEVTEWHLDRAYLSSSLVRERPPTVTIYCKAWPVHNGARFAKTAFTLDWTQQVITCPNGLALPFVPGGVVHFPAAHCAACPLRERCTASPRGRSVSIHPDERLLEELRQRQLTPQGRAQLRERVAVEHTLAHIGHWQGPRARYLGLRKNLFDTRRAAVVHNLHVIDRCFPPALAA